jgi:predicted ABC-type exoprotein transport system permease subunit
MAANMKSVVFRYVTVFNLLDRYQRFRETCWSHLIPYYDQTTRRHISKHCYLHMNVVHILPSVFFKIYFDSNLPSGLEAKSFHLSHTSYTKCPTHFA